MNQRNKLRIQVRQDIEKETWNSSKIRQWLRECIAEEQSPELFQDAVISLGKQLGFAIEYGSEVGKPGDDTYEYGVWKNNDGDVIIVDGKMMLDADLNINQLGSYLSEIQQTAGRVLEHVFGLYVVGAAEPAEMKTLSHHIMDSQYNDRIQLIHYEDLIELVKLKEQLMPVFGTKVACKIQSLIMPQNIIDIGCMVRLIDDITTVKSKELDK